MTPPTIEATVHFARRGHCKAVRSGPSPELPPAGRVPRVARYLALAIKLDGLVRGGAVENYAELARLGHVTRARVTQILNLLSLASPCKTGLELIYSQRIESIFRESLPFALNHRVCHIQMKLRDRVRISFGPSATVSNSPHLSL